jgi:hypothetical protein
MYAAFFDSVEFLARQARSPERRLLLDRARRNRAALRDVVSLPELDAYRRQRLAEKEGATA